ncbi:proline dehydrogenase [Spizellomyces punctatus DAOM BR117]|uniref:Proline dehydrogenase n=1 Tax=Spizellomyces punctatus (strain DAOM BR117) TaxID=645134 RepID=A0A0L0HBI0_SPIPD|nr:proline dehydrogenase [Spizellomyces punctatus DAOM BR117]KNC98955.1 hypothetical protein SPPG_05914 [Spizellomyces punctatus DAOM BR117]|eukprot:XP_016606995.1 hypothetical protein SPPG_05914 [Spizellomyces punctatus DAOM BR117]
MSLPLRQLTRIRPPHGSCSLSLARSLIQTRSLATQAHNSSLDSVRPYKTRSTAELLNSLLVFQLCAMPKIVEASPTILEWAEKMKLTRPVYAVIKQTFFRHFCGGEDLAEVVPTMENFKSLKIGSILDLALEADVDAASLSGPAAQEQARKVAGMFKESIDIASKTPGSFIALKVTALVPPLILQRWSNTLVLLQAAFRKADRNGDGRLSLEEFLELSATFPHLRGDTASALFAATDRDKDGFIDWLDVTDTFSLYNSSASRSLIRPPIEPVTPDNQLISADDLDTTDLVIPDIDIVAQHARDLRVRILVDAEQTYFQPAIDDVGLNLCKKFNPPHHGPNEAGRRGPVLYNTYQLYLKDGYERLVLDVERAERNGYSFGVKIVRGAYMHAERERAEELGIPDPIQPTIEATHAAYNKAIDFLVNKISGFQSPDSNITVEGNIRPLSFVVASHNQNSVEHACQQMNQFNVPAGEGSVAFAQLMGMQDGTTFSLASKGYKVFKYIPYGPIGVTIPYLQRRALENSDVLAGGGGIVQDRKAILNELKHRLGVGRSAGGFTGPLRSKVA